MREFLTSGQVGSIELNEQKRIRQEINKRWDALGMTEGLKGVVKENVATLFENEAKALLSEATASDNSGSFETVVFPIIRRVFSKLLANDIVSVQAMNLPVGRLFFMLPVTSEREFNGTIEDALDKDADVIGRHKGLMGYERTDRHNGSKYNRFYLPDEVVNEMTFVDAEGSPVSGATYDEALANNGGRPVFQETPTVTKYHKRTLYDLFYNDFLYDNSKGKIRIKVGDVTPVAFKDYELVDLTDDLLRPYADGTLRNVILKVGGF